MRTAYSTSQLGKMVMSIIAIFLMVFGTWKTFSVNNLLENWFLIFIYFLEAIIIIILFIDIANIIRKPERIITSRYDLESNLASLPKNYHFFTCIVLPKCQTIAYIVTGPTGIWTIGVNKHSGSMILNGKELVRDYVVLERDFTHHIIEETRELEKFLKGTLAEDYYIKPVIAFVNRKAKLRQKVQTVEGVQVVSSIDIKELLTAATNEKLDFDTIHSITKAMKGYPDQREE